MSRNIFWSNGFVLENSPHYFTSDIGTNDLSSEKCSLGIAKSIINLAHSFKNKSHDVTVSTITLKSDDKKLNEKGMEVNLHLKELSNDKNFFIIIHFFKWQLRED